MYHSIGIYRENIKVCITYSEIPEKSILFIKSLRKAPKRLFYLYKTFGNIQMI